MGKEDSAALPSTIDVPAASSTTILLSRFNVAALRRDFERLSVDDLTALASFPAEPHELIGRVVAVAHCMLLSLALERTALELCAPPWPLLRLQLLDDTPKIWRKMRKRAWQLETGVKSLSPVQIRFGCKALVPFIIPRKQNPHDHGTWQLDRLAQVSTIAASLGAWVVFCLCCSVLPPLLINTRPRAPDLQNGKSAQSLPDIKPSVQDQSQHKQDAQRFVSSSGVVKTSKLLPITAQKNSSGCRGALGSKSLGEWCAYCIDANRVGQQQRKGSGLGQASESFPLNVSWWKPPHEIETQLPRTLQSFALSQLTQFAQHSLLLQLGFHEHLFERPAQCIPYAKIPRVATPIFTLKFDVVVTDSQQQLSLMGIGNASITMETTVDDLRSQLTQPIVSRLFSVVERCSSFRFLYRGSFLAVSQESNRVREHRVGGCASQLWHHYSSVSQALVNAGLPEHLQQTESLVVPGSSVASTTLAIQAFAMRQPLTPTIGACNPTAPRVSTSSVVVEFFLHWRAFVCFQQLQDSSVLFQLPQRSPKSQTKSPQKLSKHRLNSSNEDDRDERVPYGPHPQQLPRKKFNSKKEWLLSLYAVADITSATSAVFKTPFHQDVEHALASPCRLVLAEESNVIHLTRISHVITERAAFGVQLAVFDVTFVRDETCSLESLTKLVGVYVWLIVPRKTHKNRDGLEQPTEWMIDLYRFVQHPTFDFQSSSYQLANHFRVRMPWHVAERAIEAEFWSKDVDWTPAISSTDLYATVLRQIFDTMCRSHPPAFGVDSVKFSKLLYEAKIQPTLLSIGDAAFLFASNLTPGFTYEMDFDGFVRTIEWLSQQFYTETTKTSPSKALPGIQHAMVTWQLSRSNARDRLLASLRRFCYETLVHLPSLTSTWHEIMDSWRRARKQQYLQEYALKYCAATRLRASWIGLVTWRIFSRRRQRMKEERLAATKIQSIARERKHYLEYHRVRRIIMGTQLRIHARSELRRLRSEQAAFVECMRLRIVNWMRYYLWRLQKWKRLNAEKVARRDRIREKQLRRLGDAVFPSDISCVHFSLYRAQSVSVNGDVDLAPQRNGSSEMYDLEVVDPSRSWGHVLSVSRHKVDQFIVEEAERLLLQLELGLAALAKPSQKLVPNSAPSTSTLVQSKLPRRPNQANAFVARDSVVHPLLEPNIILLALARRLVILKDAQRDPVGLRWYNDPTDTSLGKLVFKGALRSESVHPVCHAGIFVQRHVVRVLEWADTFKFLMYTPATSVRRRYDLDASFIHSVLQFSRFGSMRLTIQDEEDGVVALDKVEADRAPEPGNTLSDPSQYIPHQIHRILNGPHKVLALQNVLSYVLKYGVRTPTYAMMPHVVAERERKHEERDSKQRNTKLARERQLVVMVQTRLRQQLARKTRQQLALSSYSKHFDRESGRFLYILQYQSGIRIVLGERKPFSLFDKDVPLPPDEWQLVSTSDNNICFFNPRRGVYSRFNGIIAATAIQHWFRGKMWNGVINWKLRDTAHALRYQSDVQKPTNMTDPGELENLKRYGLQLHTLQHQYKTAYSIYEAALKLSPDDPQTLVCFAILLVISCRYPAAQSWKRGMAFLQQVCTLVGYDIGSILHEVEQNAFRWALFLQPTNPHAIANYAAYLQCVHLDIDKAELLYRRALDLDPANEMFVTNFQRLRSERAPGGQYAFAGPGKIALAHSSEVRRCGPESQWREMEDPAAQPPRPKRFFQDLRTSKCTWELPTEDQTSILSVERDTVAHDTNVSHSPRT